MTIFKQRRFVSVQRRNVRLKNTFLITRLFEYMSLNFCNICIEKRLMIILDLQHIFHIFPGERIIFEESEIYRINIFEVTQQN